MTLEDALAFWYGRVDYERKQPRPGELKLDRMRALLHRLGNPHDRLRIVHVAGTKGKGSTAAMLAAVLRQAGHRTGLFTSPHLCRVEERFQVNGVPISAPELVAILEDIERATTAPGGRLEPTFFEIATAIGFLHFRRRRVEAAVLEVGLGGRFDSTNVCTPAAAVITSISFDHVQQLGNKLASIAREKAGIIKPGRPVISGATAPEARGVIEAVSRQRRAPLSQLGVHFTYDYGPGFVTPETVRRPQVQVRTAARLWPRMELGLLGEHQAVNAAVAVRTVEVLRHQGWHISDDAVASGLADVSWPARMEVVRRRPFVVLDCAHNVASAEALVATLLSSFPPGPRRLVFAGLSDKDLSGMLRVLAPHFAHAYLTRFTSNPRGAPPEELAEQLRAVAPLAHSVHGSPPEALDEALTQAGPDDLICVTGSVFLAGELRSRLVPSDDVPKEAPR
jgi:dihydrofolate synthase/folylpolyglutamate synthase